MGRRGWTECITNGIRYLEYGNVEVRPSAKPNDGIVRWRACAPTAGDLMASAGAMIAIQRKFTLKDPQDLRDRLSIASALLEVAEVTTVREAGIFAGAVDLEWALWKLERAKTS